MPLPKRCVEPVHVSRGTVPERLQLPSELEAVTNGTLANTVRQLSSLSKHAEDMFGELTREAAGLAERANGLQARIDRLAVKVTQLDSGVEEVSIQDIQMRKAFRSSRTFHQQLFSRHSMPVAMLTTYARCDRPPPLEKLNEFRDDGKDARKFYTDPDYFFELWRREMLQDTERIQHDRGKKVRQPRSSSNSDGRSNRRVRALHSTRERQKAAAVTRGETIMQPAQLHPYGIHVDSHAAHYAQADATNVPDGNYRSPQIRPAPNQLPRPNSIEIENQQRQPRITGNGHVLMEESPYGYGGLATGSVCSGDGTPRRARPSVPPPAPPDTPTHTPLDHRSSLPPPPPPPSSPPAAGAPQSPRSPQSHAHAPPAPPSPPPPPRSQLDAHLDRMHAVIGMMSSDRSSEGPAEANGPSTLAMAPRPPSPGALLRGASALKPPPASGHPRPLQDPRSDLLKAIRDGITLRKVEKRDDDTVGKYDTIRGSGALLDVASILARRVAVELSDSSSGGDSDSDDSDQWTESRA